MRANTKLTDIEIRWIKQVYKKGKFGGDNSKAFGYRQIAKRINEGRTKAGVELIEQDTVLRALKRIEQQQVLIPTNTSRKKIICPECGHVFNIKNKRK